MNEDGIAHTKWDCKYYIVFTPKYSRKEYTKIKEYIANQMKEDKITEQIAITEVVDPFKK